MCKPKKQNQEVLTGGTPFLLMLLGRNPSVPRRGEHRLTLLRNILPSSGTSGLVAAGGEEYGMSHRAEATCTQVWLQEVAAEAAHLHIVICFFTISVRQLPGAWLPASAPS